MNQRMVLAAIVLLMAAGSSCGDKKDQAEREEAAKQAIQQGIQKEQKMMEGMAKGVESIEKKMTEAKEATKK